jgi:transcriptional regulator GlxA family with amidase domain
VGLIVDWLDNELPMKDVPCLSETFLEGLLGELLMSQPSNVRQRLALPVPSAGHAIVKQAESLIRARLAWELRLGHIATELGVSLRALYRAFSRHRDYTAHQFLNRVRLDAARKRLTTAAHDDSVSGIVFEVGFRHLGRFSNLYAQRFGEMPSETLGKAKWKH